MNITLASLSLVTLTLVVGLLGIPSSALAAHEAPGSSSRVNQYNLDNPQPIYLPVVMNEYSPLPTLLSPKNGEILNTLIPNFQFNTGDLPSASRLCLAYDPKPHPTACMIWRIAPAFLTYAVNPLTNLQPNTQYYWRVGVNPGSIDGSTRIQWSSEYTFTTGKSGIIPSAPTLVLPADGTTVSISGFDLTG